MNSLYRIIIIAFVSLLTCNTFWGQENTEILETKLTFEKKEYDVKVLLEHIISKYNINIVYDNANKDLKGKIILPEKSMTLKQVLEILCRDLPFKYILKNYYIILQPRELSSLYEIKGIVTDSLNLPLEAANLFIQGNSQGSISNSNGEYILNLPPGEYKLYCMFMGYETQNISLNLYSDRTLNFILKEEKHAIQEVKVTSQKKLYGDLEIGRTIETIEAKQIQELNVNNPSDILHARVNGVWATQTSGAPGDHQKIRIRGVNSLFGSVEPLYIVDGVLVPTVNLRSLGIADLNIHDRVQKIDLHSVNFMAKYHVVENLFFNASSSVSFRDYTFKTDVDNNYLLSDESYVILSQQYNLAYSKQIKNHEFKLTSGVKLYKDNICWKIDSAFGEFLDGENEYQPIEEIYLKGSMSRYGETGSMRRSINSIIGHFNYDYNKKYFVSLVANYDHLIEGRNVDVTDFFPSIAVNWDISREYGLKQIKKIDFFNVYANWGQSGNYALNGLSNDLYKTNIYPYFNGSGEQGYYVNNLANRRIKHEKINEFDLGTEVSLFKNRVKINIDYFFKTNSDLLLQRDIPYYYGGGTQFINIGIMKNNGKEYSIDLTPVDKSNFGWHTKFGYSRNNQYIKQLTDSNSLKFNKLDLLYPDFLVQEGGQIGSIYGYKIIGRLTKEDGVGLDRLGEAFYNIKYLNKDSTNLKINEDDKIIIGNSIPDFTWNFYNSFYYKNFELNFLIHAVIGVDKYNATKAATYITGTNWDVRAIIDSADRYLGSSLYYESNAFVEDASFIRFKMLTLSYSPNKKIFGQVFAKFSLSFENLVTITKYSGYDPEATIFTDNNFTDNALDRGAYPVPKSMYFIINLTFE